MSRLKEGWAWSMGAKMHYFKEGVSLCGRYHSKTQEFTEDQDTEDYCGLCFKIKNKENKNVN